MKQSPVASVATPNAASVAAFPPRKELHKSTPVGEYFATNPSCVPCNTVSLPFLIGKSGESVSPTMKQFPPVSIAIDQAMSIDDPPINVLQRIVPWGESLATNASVPPP